MAETDPNTPQVVDPELTVDLTRLLQIRGPLGVLNVLDTIVPVVNMGDVVTRTVTVLQPAFRSSDIFSAGLVILPAAGAILADTGALAEGTYDIAVTMAGGILLANARVDLEIRNAANTANLAVWTHLYGGFGSGFNQVGWSYTFALDLALNERLRAINIVAVITGAESAHATIFARRRA